VRPTAPTAAYWVRSSSPALALQGSSSASIERDPVGGELVPQPGRGDRGAHALEHRCVPGGVEEEGATGAGVQRTADSTAIVAARPEIARIRRPCGATVAAMRARRHCSMMRPHPGPVARVPR
jgi:hypothetical protein